MKKEKGLPTIVALIILMITIFVGVAFAGSRRIFSPRASGDCKPTTPQVTNITNSSLDISFFTTSACSSSIIIDGRTILNYKSSSKIHYFQIDNLKDDTAYKFSFINNGTTYAEDSYQTRTAKKPSGSIPTSNLAWGRVLTPDQKPLANNAILYLNIPGASLLSSLVTTSGNWNVSLASSFNGKKDNWFIPPQNIQEEIFVISDTGQVSQLTNSTSNNNPVPDIILGQNSFPSVTPAQTGSVQVSPVPTVQQNLDIKNPLQGESISAVRPDFFGTAPANTKVTIKLGPTIIINGEVTAGNNGSWHWSPTQDLIPGNYTLTASISSQTSSPQSVSRNFSVVAGVGGTLSFTASPSATIITPTMIPTIMPTPTLKPTPTLIPTIARVSKPSTSSGVPVTGSTSVTLIYFIGAIIFIAVSWLFYKKSLV